MAKLLAGIAASIDGYMALAAGIMEEST